MRKLTRLTANGGQSPDAGGGGPVVAGISDVDSSLELATMEIAGQVPSGCGFPQGRRMVQFTRDRVAGRRVGVCAGRQLETRSVSKERKRRRSLTPASCVSLTASLAWAVHHDL